MTKIKAVIYSATVVGVLLIVLFILLSYLFSKNHDASQWLLHSVEVGSTINDINSSFDQSENVSRELINFGKTSENLNEQRQKVWNDFARLKTAVADNSSQDANIELYEFAIRTRFETVDRMIKAFNEGGLPAVTTIVQTGNSIADIKRVNVSRDFVLREEKRLLETRINELHESRKLLENCVKIVFALLLAALITSFILTIRSLKRQKQTIKILDDEVNHAASNSTNSMVAESTLKDLTLKVTNFLNEQKGAN